MTRHPVFSRLAVRFCLLLLALLPAACHLADAPPGKTLLSIDADAGLLQRDTILIVLKSSGGADTLFKGKLRSLDTLSHLPASGYDGGRALIVIQGFDGGQLVYEERRDYSGSTQKNLDVDVPLDLSGSGHATSLDITPDKIRLFVGGGSLQVVAAPAATWKDKPLAWSTGDPGVATVSQTGELSPVGVGVTYVRAVFGDTARDASIVTVVRDVPVLNAGAADTSIQMGTAIVFAVKVTQEYGDVAAFAWDLDGDGVFEDSVAGAPGQTQFAAPAHVYAAASDVPIRFRARDGEGNVGTAGKKVKATNSAPRIDSAAASPATVTIKDLVSFSAVASASGAALRSFAWDFDGDGKDDLSGDLTGEKSAVKGEFRFAAEGPYEAALRVTDAGGISVKATLTVQVKLDRPSVDAGPDMAVAPAAAVRLQGKGSDTLGRIVAREWKIGNGNFAPASDSGVAVFTAPAAPGEIVCVFRVTDDDSLTAEDTLKVTVNDYRAPAVKSLLPADTVISIKDSIAFTARIEAADADLKSYTFDVDGDGKPELQGALAGKAQDLKLGRAFPGPGRFDITLTVEDQSGKTTTGQARVTVLLDPPKANAGKDTTVPAGARVNLHGKASDSLGVVRQREWKIGSGAFKIVPTGDTSFTAPSSAASLECLFRVTDDDGQSDTDTVLVMVSPSVNANLSGLTLSTGTLSPGFAAATTSYTASVPNETGSVTVKPTAAATGSTITVKGAAVVSGTASGAIDLAVGANAITVVVTAQDGTTKKTYTVTVTRAASANADLSLLAVGAGMTLGQFNSTTLTYQVTAIYTAPSCRLIPTAADPGATIKVDGSTVVSGTQSPALAFPYGMAKHTIVVLAADGATAKTYTVIVWRDGPPDVTTAYAWVRVPDGSRTLTCCVDWVYNPAGSTEFTKISTGKYRVVFSGLATLGNSEGIVHVTAMSDAAAYCKITDWTSTGDLSAGVACYDAAGAAVDANFSLAALFPRGKLNGGNAYVWSDQSTTPGLTIPYPGRSWNSQAGIEGNLVERTAAGTYTVTIKGHGGSSDLGNMMVTAVGSTNSRCMVGSWGGNTEALVATIYCKTPSGVLTDAQFNLSMAQEYSSTAYGMATAWVNGNTPDTRGPYSFSNGGMPITVDNAAVGSYSLNFGALVDQTNRGTRTSIVQVAAYGSGNATCQLDTGGWSNFSDLMTSVYCYDEAGNPVNSDFNVWVIQ